MYMGNEAGEPGLTLYEVGDDSRVLRLVQIQAECSRFSPENLIMCAPVNADYMALHPSCEEIDEADFSTLWKEVRDGRAFCSLMPDAQASWSSTVELADGNKVAVCWSPNGKKPGAVWRCVPGFDRLFALTHDAKVAWRVYNHIFLSGGRDLFTMGNLRR